MPFPSPQPGRRRDRAPFALAATALLTTLLGLVAGGPVAAHSILVSTTPGPGAELEALTEVRLDFAGDVSSDGHLVVVHTASGEVAASAYAVPQPRTVVARFDAAVPAGAHEIVWDVVAGDGHHERGRIPITVTAPVPTTAPPATAPPTSAQRPTTGEAATSVPATGAGAGDASTGDGTTGDADGEAAAGGSSGGAAGDGGVPAIAVVTVVVVVIAAVAGGVAYRSRRASTAS